MGSINAVPDVPSGTGQHTAHFTLVHVPVTCQIDEYCSYHIAPAYQVILQTTNLGGDDDKLKLKLKRMISFKLKTKIAKESQDNQS